MLPNDMKSSDEDFTLFTKEFLQLLNKYHYVPRDKFRVSKLASTVQSVAIQADGQYIWVVVQDMDTGNLYKALMEENNEK